MKKKNIVFITVIITLVLALILTAVIIHKMKMFNAISDEKAKIKENNIMTLITEDAGSRNKNYGGDNLTTYRTITQQNDKNWKDIYLNFIKEEKQKNSFTLTDFEYAFVSIKESNIPFLLVHDDWNMYLFYQEDGTIFQALNSSGDPLSLSRMDTAYIKDGNLFLEGSCGAPKAFYLCQVICEGGFSLKFLAEGYYTGSGDVVYHDDEGHAVSKETYDNARADAINDAQKILFSH